jgi:hypothetical protein
MRTKLLAFIVMLGATSAFGGSGHTNNAAWLAYGYGHAANPEAIREMATRMHKDFAVPYWFLNCGLLNSTGQIGDPPARLPAFLDTLWNWEQENGYRFTVLAMINGHTAKLDLGDATVRSNIVAEAKRFVTMPGRGFDGVQLDLEPAGGSPQRFEQINRLMTEIKAAIRGKLTSFAAPKIGATQWSWPAEHFTAMATNVDLLAVMTYDSGRTNGGEYADWVRDHTVQALQAVRGTSAKILIGFPAYPNNRWHTNTAENVSFAAAGVKAALKELPATANFLGAAVYVHADGTGTDGRAGYETDWRAFRENWLETQSGGSRR